MKLKRIYFCMFVLLYTILGANSVGAATGDSATYTVNYWMQKLTATEVTEGKDNYYLQKSIVDYGDVGSVIEPSVEEFDGFTSPTAKSMELTENQSDNVLNYYYTRNSYNVVIEGDSGCSISVNKSLKYDSQVRFELSVLPAYEFKEWQVTGIEQPTSLRVSFRVPSNDVSLKAVTVPKEYHIEYDLDGGSVVDNPTVYNCLSNTFVLSTPSKSGYDFVGWSGTGIDGVVESVVIPEGSYGDKSFKANWKIHKYSINLDLDGGTYEGVREYTIEDNTFTLNTPTKKGYKFVGWLLPDGLVCKSILVAGGRVGDLSYTAVWEKDLDVDLVVKHYKQSVDGNSYELDYTETLTRTVGDVVTIPTKEYEGFVSPGEAVFEVVADVTVNYYYNRVLTAVYFHSDKGIEVPIESRIKYVRYGEVIESPSVSVKDGYAWRGWKLADGSVVDDNTVSVKGGTEGCVLQALSLLCEYSIEYKLNGGRLADGASNPSVYTVETNTFYLNNPTRKWYTFKGWSLGDGEPNVMTSVNKNSTGNKCFSACWEKNSIAVSEDNELQGDTFWSISNGKLIIKGTTDLTDLDTIPWEDYKYLITGLDLSEYYGKLLSIQNWFSNCVNLKEFPELPDTIINAQEAFMGCTGLHGTIHVTFDVGCCVSDTFKDTSSDLVVVSDDECLIQELEGVSAFSTSKDFYVFINGEEKVLKYNYYTQTFVVSPPLRKGYEFIGWNVEDSEQLVDLVSVEQGSTGDIHLTSNYKPIQYSIEYDYDIGDVVRDNKESYTIEDEGFIIKNPEKFGYDFVGWCVNGSSVPLSTVAIPSGSTGDLFLKAEWSRRVYTLDQEYELVDGVFWKVSNNTLFLWGTGDVDALPEIPWHELASSIEKFDCSKLSGRIYSMDRWFNDCVNMTELPEIPYSVRTINYCFSGCSGLNRIVRFHCNKKEEMKGVFSGTKDGITIVCNDDIVARVLKDDRAISVDKVYTVTCINAESSNTTYTFNTDTFSLKIPEKVGYKFEHWRDEQDNILYSAVIQTGSIGDRVFRAKYSPIVYKAVVNGADGSIVNYTFTVETDSFVIDVPELDGFKFIGWSINNSDELVETACINKGTVGDVLLVPRYEKIAEEPIEKPSEESTETPITFEECKNLYGKIVCYRGSDNKYYSLDKTKVLEDADVFNLLYKPDACSITGVSFSKKDVKIKFKKDSKATKCEVQYSTSSKFKGSKSITVGAKSGKVVIKNLKGKKNYYVRMRYYKSVNGVKYYSGWRSVQIHSIKNGKKYYNFITY